MKILCCIAGVMLPPLERPAPLVDEEGNDLAADGSRPHQPSASRYVFKCSSVAALLVCCWPLMLFEQEPFHTCSTARPQVA
jgi:hypothetical protein